jgi:predicted MPP superfamily phosphohydrolase
MVVGYGAFVERTGFRVREVDLPVPDLPPDLEGLRLVHFSDIHLSPFLTEREFARAIDAANTARPHLAIVTGDLISSRGDPIDACLRQLARLRADAGILGCMGNHEVYARVLEHASTEGARRGIRFLRGAAETLHFGSATLHVAGVDYQRFSLRPHYLAGAEALRREGAVNLLLSHNPDVFPAAARKGFDLVLSGHTHGGQVNIELLDQQVNVARFFTPYVYGLYREGRSSAYVTRGVGTIGIPARIGAPPEVALLRLKRA